MNLDMGRKFSLRRELIFALLLKFAAIFVLWSLFFSSPMDDRLDGTRVGETVFGSTSAPPPASQQLHYTEEMKR